MRNIVVDISVLVLMVSSVVSGYNVYHKRHERNKRNKKNNYYALHPAPAYPPSYTMSDSDEDLSHESRLINYLLHKYHRVGTFARPVKDSSKPVFVGFRMTLVQILDFDETKQLLLTNVWKSYQWRDETLTWNPSEFGGITDLRLPPHIIWTPDVVLYNNADEQYEREQHHELIAVRNNGSLNWIPSAIYKSSCLVDMGNFPFDEQTCHFKFGSWTYDGYKLNLHFLLNDATIDMGEYIRSAEWDILESEGIRLERNYPCCGDDPYPELIYTVKVKRRTAFYIVVLILPSVLLSCLTLVIFWFPPTRPDRTGLGMSLFSSFFVLLLILVQASPPTAHSISRLGIYYCINMILIALSTTISAVVINMFKKKDQMVPVPQWFLHLAMRQTWHHSLLKLQGEMYSTKYTKDGRKIKPETSTGPISIDPQTGQALIQYRTLATIIDRAFFIIYFLCIFISMSVVFPR